MSAQEPAAATNVVKPSGGFSFERWEFVTNFTEITKRPQALPRAEPSAEADVLAAKLKVGRWIWDKKYVDRQSCRFWRAFLIPEYKNLRKAVLRVTADDYYHVLLDGQDIGIGANWRILNDYDVTWMLNSGAHVLAVEAHNEDREAGLLVGLELEYTDGTKTLIGSDKSWRLVPNDEPGWAARSIPAPHWPLATEASVVGQFPRWRQPQAVITSIVPAPKVLHFWQRAWFVSSLVSLCCGVVVLVVRQRARLAVQHRAQQMLAVERVRIARDIHDDLGARLTQLVLQSEVALTRLPEGAPARQQFTQLAERARGAARALDEVVWAVNSRRDTVRDFASHLCKYAQAFLEVTPLRCRLDVPAELPELPFDLAARRGLFLAVKEALNNAAKYSQATELFLRLQLAPGRVRIVIEDNGRGFDLALADADRNGLQNMAQRLRELGGEFHLTSQPGAGCRVALTMPLREGAVAAAIENLLGKQTSA